jgi:threonine dehydrogenase-like Zn-dependent dehydrogenase
MVRHEFKSNRMVNNQHIGPGVIPKEGSPHPSTNGTIPVVLGHEFCGRIAETSPGSKLQIGQAVMVDPRLYCATCSVCKSSTTNRCSLWGFNGLAGGENGGNGGLSETVVVKESMVHVLPDSVPLSIAAIIEPLTVVTHAIKISQIESFKGVSVLILGGGPIGIALIYALRANGGDAIFVSEPTSTRRKQVAEIADAVIDPIAENVPSRCRELTKDVGVDVVFDCAGVQVALEGGAEALRLGGTFVIIAGWVKQVRYFTRSLT